MNLMTHKAYLQKLYPYILSSDIPDFAERKLKDSENARKRNSMLDEFIRDENSIGWPLKDTFEELNKKIMQPKEMPVGHKLHDLLDKYYSIIPSFFRFHVYLDSIASENTDFSYKIIFRTFGMDHKEIYDEYTEYLKGTHPLFENPFPKEKLFSQQYAN